MSRIHNLKVEQKGEKTWLPHVAYTSTSANDEGSWYFDNGCSRHMTGHQSVLDEYIGERVGKVKFGGGSKGNIKGK